MFDLQALTVVLQTCLTDDKYLVGIGEAPRAGGWSGGTPGDGVYKPYLVLLHGGSSPIFDATLSGHERDWQVNFTVRASAASYGQLNGLGSKWRQHIEDWVRDDPSFGSPAWGIANLVWNSLGPAEPNRSTSPTTWRQQDSVGFIVTKP